MKFPLTREQHHELYYFMRLNRSLEERLVRLFRQNKVVGGLYTSLGQEAISVGTCYALEKRDWIAPMIRNVGALLVKGYRPSDIFMQYMARHGSPTRGKDNTSHFGDLHDRHVVSPISMLGDLIPVMTGVAIGGRYLGQKIVAMTWIGDGGTSTGAFHEGMNFAAVQRAPFVLVVENNQWAYSTPVSRQVPVRDLADRAKAYGVASYVVDGNDVVAVYQTAKEAVERCRAGEGPVLIEAKTMRMRGHAQHDPAEYVPKEMFEYWKARDPIDRYERFLTEQKLWTAKDKAKMDARIEKELEEDFQIAENSPMPPPELAEQDVYCDDSVKIEPRWERPKMEVMPPKTSAEPVWKVEDFGGLESGNGAKASAPAAARAAAAAEGGDGARAPRRPRKPRKPAKAAARGRRS
jgi:pyruvate dehydrogenase E1 component alpha subunit/2-oxoisovalerate dehydrogenase E1 component alpha subunit